LASFRYPAETGKPGKMIPVSINAEKGSPPPIEKHLPLRQTPSSHRNLFPAKKGIPLPNAELRFRSASVPSPGGHCFVAAVYSPAGSVKEFPVPARLADHVCFAAYAFIMFCFLFTYQPGFSLFANNQSDPYPFIVSISGNNLVITIQRIYHTTTGCRL
jgi:hypothetical protein